MIEARARKQMWRRGGTLLLGLALLAAVRLAFGERPSAQASAASPAARPATNITAYDVAAIRPGKGDTDGWGIDTNANTLTATNVPIRALVADAFGIRQDLISGEPAWADSAHYDIQAKIVDADPEALKKLTEPERRALLRALLAERFHLKTHTETKTLPVYELVQAKGGPKIAATARPPKTDAPVGEDKFKGVSRGGMSIHSSGSKAELSAHAITLAQFAEGLSHQLRRTILDKTGLAGKFDFALVWAPDNGAAPSPEATAAPLFTALQEQLGLKLEAAKGPVETLVIDHLEPPTAN